MAEHTPEVGERQKYEQCVKAGTNYFCAACGTDWDTREEAVSCTERCAMKLATWDDLLAACEAAVKMLQDRERFVMLGPMGMGQVEQVLKTAIAKARGE